MKCVIALALLFSAQALKMENKPSYRAMMDEFDRKAGRPLRSEKRKAWNGDDKADIENGLTGGVWDIVAQVGGDTEWGSCKGSSESCLDSLSAFVADQADLDTDTCNMYWSYFTDAEYYAVQLAEAYMALIDFDDKMKTDAFHVPEEKMKRFSSKKTGIDYELLLVDVSVAFWNFWGAIDDLQSMINAGDACSTMIEYNMANLIDAGSFETGIDTTIADGDGQLQAWFDFLVQDKYGGTDESGATVNDLTSVMTKAYDIAVANSKRHKNAYIRMRAQAQRHKNRFNAKKGIGPKKGRGL